MPATLRARLSADDVVASTLAAVDERELCASIAEGLRVFAPFATQDITEHIPPRWARTLRHPNGGRPRTFPQLVSAVRHQSTGVSA